MISVRKSWNKVSDGFGDLVIVLVLSITGLLPIFLVGGSLSDHRSGPFSSARFN